MKNNTGRHRYRLTQKDIQNLTCFFYNESSGLLASVFFNLPLPLKRHSVQVAAIAGRMALYAPEGAAPADMEPGDYANAVRYGCLYHDIGIYLVYNQRPLFPTAGERFLREELAAEAISPAARRVILETVRFYGERYDGQGYPDRLAGENIPLHASICAVADAVDDTVAGRHGLLLNPVAEAKRYIFANSGTAFAPAAVKCFAAAYPEIAQLYRHWRKTPPFWKNNDIKPLERGIGREIG